MTVNNLKVSTKIKHFNEYAQKQCVKIVLNDFKIRSVSEYGAILFALSIIEAK